MKALIIGGGISGAATVLALHKAGIDSELFEARDSHSDGVGAFLTLAVNGITTLRLLGLDVSGLPGGIDTPRMRMVLHDGTPLSTFPLGPTLADGTVSRTVRRADLYAALRARVIEIGIPVSYGARLEDADTAPDGTVTARFADGRTASGDLLIGADGLHSRVRTVIDTNAPAPRYLGILNSGGFATAVDAAGEAGTMQMIFGTKTFFSWLPDGQGGAWWFANPPMRREPARGQLSKVPEAKWRRTLLELVANDAGPAARIIEATDRMFAPWPTHDFPTVPVWHRGNMVIIGDAAHAASPSSGQGASLAIEDAAVLALALRDEPNIPAAFAAFEAARRGRVSRIVAMGKRNGDGKTPGPFGRVVRDVFLRLIFSRPPRERDLRWLYEYPIDWEAGVTQPPPR